MYCISCPLPKVTSSFVTVYLAPFNPLLPSHSLPCGNHHTVVYVYEFQFYIPHMSKIIWFLAFSNWFILLGIILSRSTQHCCHKWQYFIFSYGSVLFHCVYVSHRRALWLSPCLGHRDYEHRGVCVNCTSIPPVPSLCSDHERTSEC